MPGIGQQNNHLRIFFKTPRFCYAVFVGTGQRWGKAGGGRDTPQVLCFEKDLQVLLVVSISHPNLFFQKAEKYC